MKKSLGIANVAAAALVALFIRFGSHAGYAGTDAGGSRAQ